MSILVDRDILKALKSELISIDPFNENQLGPNSYDVTLAPALKTYRLTDSRGYRIPLDCQADNPTQMLQIPEEGFTLSPGVLYLGSTIEHTSSSGFAPKFNGKSSLGRLGLSVHITAGEGDVGFCGNWTLEMTVIHPLIVYARMPIGQLLWQTISSTPIHSYQERASSKYQGQKGPTSSRMYQNFHNK